MLTLQVLNSDSTINSFFIGSTAEVISGEDVIIRLRIFQKDKNIRYIAEATATISFDLLKSDGTTLTKTASFPFSDDHSIIEFSLTAAETAEVIGQTLVADISETAGISKAILQFGLKKILPSGC
jgi:hypothetical protein